MTHDPLCKGWYETLKHKEQFRFTNSHYYRTVCKGLQLQLVQMSDIYGVAIDGVPTNITPDILSQVRAFLAVSSNCFAAAALRSLYRSVSSSTLSRNSTVNRYNSSITSTTRSR